jgi:NAD(P)-dependent dehydrogenase (short-subunit alcohol dehydrogenase family)
MSGRISRTIRAEGNLPMNNHASMLDLTGKTAVVTGASYGLGVTMAETLAGAGATVALVARSAEKLQQVAEKIEKQGGNTVVFTCDVGDPAQVARMAAAILAKFGRVDILVNNAGVAAEAGAMPEMIPDELFEQTVRINLLGLWYCCREFGAAMLREGKGGSIINIASIAGMAGWRDAAPAYQATKAAVINLTKNLACSWGDRRVRVNAIAPGWFPSELTKPLFAMGSMTARLSAGAALGRLGNPEELAGPLLFLASDASSFVTGHTLVVDGGFSAGSGQFSWPEEFYGIMEEAMPNGTGKRIMPA